ncbi:hypothetical protein FOCG_00119 [Fusarium oxysporum f. sp. radicis-lycopersici 26381]|uniref:Uncharacterized protein n=3 Tax=Fusarium oxysporum TaxID=5507 RepID=A0A420P652_FUSOX|nr:fungal-specific transcription factor domain-containing protein [Fusarium oxysporum Fo47]EXL60843.1 hypothetical protein FOCG_00119 [Fusarium oxysporum f. sp. radicis-lycopersici 26381]RKK21625.1 hypothetical protein BFJ65_g4261 [Fusarium oxysporum f. sp. cepae]RKK87985.1 hypothetical protein BFJ71_g13122 [Fusarium oxysporum]EWZ43511.1 hypothetical protein FOZG_04606 [Fusarium oxysporum Fo47]QKD50594.2 fungal-specific transcription factor domain-domain-containing protein [Fusarium oxysporum 
MVPIVSESVSNQANEQRPRKRVRMACNRCRRQKLKCDTERPCALCTRSGVECVTDSRDASWYREQDRSSIVESGGPPATTTPRPGREFNNPITPNAWSMGTQWQPTSFQATGHLNEDTRIPRNSPRDTSAVKLTQQILQQLSPDTSLNTDTSALPGGSGNNQALSSDVVPINQILGLDLPSKPVSDHLINVYFESVHWFMVLFHEPSFRQRYDALMVAGQASLSDTSFLVCLMLLLAIGARYIDPASNLPREVADTDLDALQRKLLDKTRVHLLDIIEVGGVEGVQICVLLSTFYLYHDRPNLAFAIHGMGVKCAHAMYLHQEATWKEPTALTREIKRRVWWALYVVDCFYSIIFGRPRSVRDEESNVAMVRNLEDTATRHPAFNSTENVSGSSFPVTIFSYQRYKFRLYTIAARVMRDIYFGNSSTPLTSVSQTIQSISRDLESWFQSLPPELKHSSGSDSNLVMQQDQEPPKNNIVRMFRLQAMTLQLAYDNIQILLHRPLLQLPIGSDSLQSIHSIITRARGSTANEPDLSAIDGTILSMSKAQCYKSAIRTACLNVSIVQEARHTHAASYVGIQMFTAGMVLSIAALSAPLSSEAQQAKRAIGRIVSTMASIGNETLLSAQSQQVLKQLVRLILEKEMNSIFAETTGQFDTLQPGKSNFQDPSQPMPCQSPPVPTQNASDNPQSTVQTDPTPCEPTGDSSMVRRYDLDTADEFMQETWNDILPTASFDYSEGISSVRQVFSQTAYPQVTRPGWTDYPVNPSLLTESAEPVDNLTRPFRFSPPGNGFQGVGQAWLWDDGPLQPVNMDSGENSTF